MGMLLTHHDGYWPEGDDPAEPVAEPDSAYEALSDDELFEAYVTNVGEDGEAESREDMIAELSALDAAASE